MKNGKAIFISFLFFLIYSAVLWFVFTLPYPKFQTISDDLPQLINNNLVDRYPNDLVISAEKGIVTINKPSPYCLVLDEKSKYGIVYDALSSPSLLNTFDQNSPYRNLCQPIALVGTNFIMTYDSDNGQIKINKISETITYTIEKSTISSIANQLIPVINQIGIVAYYVIPLLIFLSLFLFTLSSNFWYTFTSKLLLKLFKVDVSLLKGKIYGTCLFIFNIIQFLNLVIFGWFINKKLGQNYSLSFPFCNTIIISIASFIYFKFLSDSIPKTVFSTTPPSLPPNSPPPSPTPAPSNPVQTSSSNEPPPPRKVHVDITSLSQFPPDNDQTPPPGQV